MNADMMEALQAVASERGLSIDTLFAALAEVDHIAVMGMGGAAVHLLTADVGEDHLGVLWVLGNQPLHRGDRRWDARCVVVSRAGIIEGEAHAQHDRAHKALAGVGCQLLWIVVATIGE